MTPTKIEIEKLTKNTDFSLWKLRVKALLSDYGADDALLGDEGLKDIKDEAKKQELKKKAYNTLIHTLSDEALREVVKCTDAKGIWDKLEEVYMVKTSA